MKNHIPAETVEIVTLHKWRAPNLVIRVFFSGVFISMFNALFYK